MIGKNLGTTLLIIHEENGSTNDREMGGDLYTWVLKRRKEEDLMSQILDRFSQQELDELEAEGFKVK